MGFYPLFTLRAQATLASHERRVYVANCGATFAPKLTAHVRGKEFSGGLSRCGF